MSNTPDGFLFPQLADPTFPFVQRVLRPINPRLWLTLHEPWADFQRARDHDPDLRDYREGEVAGWLHPKIIRSATRLFADQKGVGRARRRATALVNAAERPST